MAVRLRICLPLVLASVFWAHSSYAINFNAAADFSAVNNPNGAWSYGYMDSLAGTFFAYNNTISPSGLSIWYASETELRQGYIDIDPVITHNGTNAAIGSGNLIWAPGELSLHPGVVTGPFNVHPYSVLRWTAPSAGEYAINALFYGLDLTGTTTDVHILLNGIGIFSDDVIGFGSASKQSFLGSRFLNLGDTLDFAVGPAAYLPPYYDYEFDTTGISVNISQDVPEPASITLTFLGLVGLYAIRRRWK
jgi:hypothetical protein